jgi:hypothetical protein
VVAAELCVQHERQCQVTLASRRLWFILCTSRPSAVQAAAIMEHQRGTSVLVIDDEQRVIGALNTNDLMHAKVI